MRPQAVLPNALAAVGDTPLIRLNRIPQAEGLKCNMLVKCEYFNAGGSVKDRIARRMLLSAEKKGILIPGKSVVIEPTSGNTGIGLALACAIKGYRCIIVLPEKMSKEKVNTLRALGAEVVRTPTEAAWDDPRSNIMTARRLKEEIPDAVILDQYNNLDNPTAHWATAEEIIEAITASEGPSEESSLNAGMGTSKSGGMPSVDSSSILGQPGARPLTPEESPELTPRGDGNLPAPSAVSTFASSGLVDVLVCGVGTGGTISGISSRIKRGDHNPTCHVLGVDPVGSTLALPATLNALEDGNDGSYKVEGIGYDFDPNTLNKALIDTWIKTEDQESFAGSRRLIREEGILAGGSSGAAIAGAIRFLKGDGWEKFGSKEGVNVVIVLPDSLRNYVTKPWLVEDAKEETHVY
ncbi:pyridoxal phosphate-dependent enzyme, beta subunit [Violaceomyces palustris]|uniref:Pyridoxal phosphate-dependent enzyme, beta subunit n=1 Tax=Violaceomyces palustris TaxID=1673888 RepID=A0ACD0NY96_9BASI|nr:pyridoxal phosphate-dependent enzyme, beta subunit [Violaceomyces palustris]